MLPYSRHRYESDAADGRAGCRSDCDGAGQRYEGDDDRSVNACHERGQYGNQTGQQYGCERM